MQQGPLHPAPVVPLQHQAWKVKQRGKQQIQQNPLRRKPQGCGQPAGPQQSVDQFRALGFADQLFEQCGVGSGQSRFALSTRQRRTRIRQPPLPVTDPGSIWPALTQGQATQPAGRQVVGDPAQQQRQQHPIAAATEQWQDDR